MIYSFCILKGSGKVLNINEQLHLFTEIDGTIYYCEGFPKVKEDDIKNSWEKVVAVKDDWYIVNITGKLAVFYREGKGIKSFFTGLKREEGRWSGFFPPILKVPLVSIFQYSG